ncbi:MAG: hypothetical protein EA425_06310 [Puniceicoccaceae bacterium]|nr:MAG: hypothetical protein EA425_06310 [Puniceicoccaceae bacterium]
MARTYGKPIPLVETAYCWRPTEYRETTGPFPESPEGQRNFLLAVAEVVRSVPDGLGRGVCWWEAAVGGVHTAPACGAEGCLMKTAPPAGEEGVRRLRPTRPAPSVAISKRPGGAAAADPTSYWGDRMGLMDGPSRNGSKCKKITCSCMAGRCSAEAIARKNTRGLSAGLDCSPTRQLGIMQHPLFDMPSSSDTAFPETFSAFGSFDRSARTFVLTAAPPRKWRNVHYNAPGDHELWAQVSNLGDGPTVYRDAEGNTSQLVSWDRKYVYLRDDDSGLCFSPGGGPLPEPPASTRTVYHAAFTQTEGERDGLVASHRVFVPADACVEIWTVQVTNRSDRARTVSVFGYAQMPLGGQRADGSGHHADNHSEIDPGFNGVLVLNRSRRRPAGRFDGFMTTNSPHYLAATGYRDWFTHEDYSLSTPKLIRGWNCDSRPGCGPDCAAVLQCRATLRPEETARFDFILGPTDGATQALEAASWTAERIETAWSHQVQLENRRSSRLEITTGHVLIDALVTDFSKKQMVFYNIYKSGFRDNLQNDMGLAMSDYALVRQNLFPALASQYANGDVPHGFRPRNLLPYADKPAWILHCIPWIIQESGDFSLLDEPVPFFDSQESGSVWEHMVRAMRFLASQTGANGLCDQRFADWDDGLEPSDKTGARESVMVTQQFCLGLLEMQELARRRGETSLADEAVRLHRDFTERLNSIAWDGAWYRRTFCEGGYIAGTSANEEGRIYFYCQPWAVLSRTAPGDRARICMESVDRLCESDVGFAIVHPPYSKFDERIGKKSAMRPHYATNGGAYCHAAGFKLVADCMLGRAEEAWRTVLKVAPDNPWNPLGQSKTEPFAWTNCYDRIPQIYGQAQYPWATGTASWFCMGIVEWILGARRHYDGLLIDPCLPLAIKEAALRREYRGATYNIFLDHRSGRGKGVTSLTLDGREVGGTLIAPQPPGEYTVHVVV